MQVTWEVAEVGFRLELQALDRHLVHDNAGVDRLLSQVFADRPLIPPLPSTTEPLVEGLSALTVAGRRRSLEALRQLLVRWPGADASITPMPLDSERMPDVEVLAQWRKPPSARDFSLNARAKSRFQVRASRNAKPVQAWLSLPHPTSHFLSTSQVLPPGSAAQSRFPVPRHPIKRL